MYGDIDRPYDHLMRRVPQEDPAQVRVAPTENAPSLTEVQTFQQAPRRLQGGQEVTDIKVRSTIQSLDYKPQLTGFLIDGRSGAAYFNHVFISSQNPWPGLDIRKTGGDGSGLYILMSGPVTGHAIEVVQESDTAAIDVTTKNVTGAGGGATIHGKNLSGDGSVMSLEQDGDGVVAYFERKNPEVGETHFYPIMLYSGGDYTYLIKVWISDGTDPNGDLTGSVGDACHDTSGKLWVCRGGTVWRDLSGSDTYLSSAAGEPLAAGDAVAVESGGLYRTRAKGTSGTVAGTLLGSFANYENSTYCKRRGLSLSDTVKATFGQDSGIVAGASYRPYVFRAVVSPTAGTVTGGSSSSVLSFNADIFYYFDMVQLAGNVAVCAYFIRDASTGLYHLAVRTVDFSAGIAFGAETRSAGIPSSSVSRGLAVERFSDSEAIIAYTDGTDAKAVQITVSGGACTMGSVSTVRASTTFVSEIKRFGTSDYYCFWLSDAAPFGMTMVICGLYASGTFTMGGEAWILASTALNEPTSGASYGDETMICVSVYGVSHTYVARVISRSGLGLTVGSPVSLGWNSAGGPAGYPCLTRIGSNFFMIGGYYFQGGLNSCAWSFWKFSGSSLTPIGTTYSMADGVNTFMAGPVEFSSSRLLAFIGDAGAWTTGVKAVPIDLVTNHDSAIGLAAEAIAQGSRGMITVFGENFNQAGLTTGAKYYSYLEGMITSTKYYGGKLLGIATGSTSILTKI